MRRMALKFFKASTLGKGCVPVRSATLLANWAR